MCSWDELEKMSESELEHLKTYTIVECPRCRKEIAIALEILDSIIFVHQEEELEDIDLQPEYYENEMEPDA